MARYNASIYMDNGAVITFDCDGISCKKDSASKFTSVSWENINLSLLSLDLAHVIAITAKEVA